MCCRFAPQVILSWRLFSIKINGKTFIIAYMIMCGFFQVWKPRLEIHPSWSVPASSLWSCGTHTAATTTSVWQQRRSNRSGMLFFRTVLDMPTMVSTATDFWSHVWNVLFWSVLGLQHSFSEKSGTIFCLFVFLQNLFWDNRSGTIFCTLD